MSPSLQRKSLSHLIKVEVVKYHRRPRAHHLNTYMTGSNIQQLTYAELIELSKKLHEEIASKRVEELKVVVDGFAKKLEAAGFTVDEAIKALLPYSTRKAVRRSASGAGTPVLYRDPANPESTWSGRGARQDGLRPMRPAVAAATNSRSRSTLRQASDGRVG